MTEYETIPVRKDGDVKERVTDLRHDLRVESMDAVVRELLDAYEREHAREGE